MKKNEVTIIWGTEAVRGTLCYIKSGNISVCVSGLLFVCVV